MYSTRVMYYTKSKNNYSIRYCVVSGITNQLVSTIYILSIGTFEPYYSSRISSIALSSIRRDR